MKRLLVIATACLAIACGSGSSTAPTLASVAGTWNLQRVNGSPLPYPLQVVQGGSIALISDQIVAGASGGFTETTTLSISVAGQNQQRPVSTMTGVFVVNGTAVSYSTSTGLTGTGTLNGNVFILASNGLSYTYAKQ